MYRLTARIPRTIVTNTCSRTFTTQYPKSVPLNYQVHKYTGVDPNPPKVLILHGLLGHLGNWRTITSNKKLQEECQVITADLRNHGSSPHHPDMSFEATSDDIAQLISTVSSEPVVLVGHSLGGKVACTTALRYPHLISKLVVVDILPVEYGSVDGELKAVHSILEAVYSAPLDMFTTRQEVDAYLSQNGIEDAAVRMFVLTNLVVQDNTLSWKPAIGLLRDAYDHIRCFDIPPTPKYDGPTLLMRGTQSRYVWPETQEDIMDKYFTDVEYTALEAGHWLHAQKPLEFIEELLKFVKK